MWHNALLEFRCIKHCCKTRDLVWHTGYGKMVAGNELTSGEAGDCRKEDENIRTWGVGLDRLPSANTLLRLRLRSRSGRGGLGGTLWREGEAVAASNRRVGPQKSAMAGL